MSDLTPVVVALVAGLFSLAPIMLQVATTRAQRRDRSYRLDNLRSELEFLERLSDLQENIGAEDDPAQLQMQGRIHNAMSNLLDRYTALPETAPSVTTVQPPSHQPSLFRRILLLYKPGTALGWVWHILYYFLLLFIINLLIYGFINPPHDTVTGAPYSGIQVFEIKVFEVMVFSLPLLILQRLAQYAARHAEVRSKAADSP